VLVQCNNKKCNEVQILTRENKCVKCGKRLQ
jgi:rRNA maturation protein Nop10